MQSLHRNPYHFIVLVRLLAFWRVYGSRVADSQGSRNEGFEAGALMVRIRFRGPLHYRKRRAHQNSIGTYLGPYINYTFSHFSQGLSTWGLWAKVKRSAFEGPACDGVEYRGPLAFIELDQGLGV